ncbi:hypothetical protein CRG98_015341 [Punica granatum]|uniref:ABC transporter B family member 9-like n=1 Tax=Punica granatum TaxID=22663 RepID=A0A2I0K6T6_PUNGR|nr:hypothetical protein CRG98_015341 [Punica granatum]
MVTGERQAARIRALDLRTILRQDIAFYDTTAATGEVVGRMSGDIILIHDAIGEKVGKFIQLLSTFVAGFAIAFVRDWLLSLVLLSCIPLIMTAGATLAVVLSRMSSLGQAAYSQAGNIAEQTIGAIRTIASFTEEKSAIDNEKLEIAYKATLKQEITTGLGGGCVVLIIFCTCELAIWYGSKLIITKGYNGRQIITILMAIMTGGMSLGQASPSLKAFALGQDCAGGREIKLRDVHFRYPARPDVQTLSGFSLSVPSGSTAALVGQSGSGKSTVICLLERFYDPNSGEVLIDGVNLKNLQLKWIRQKIGLVSQEPVLFLTTTRENIAYGKENATDKEIKAAIKLANAAKFIDNLPKGLDTMVGEHGTQLSGGQKQRIAIARAILKNPKILLLDEATIALDAESERTVQDALDRVMENRTTIVVALRLTTIRNANIIAVVHKGKFVEQGVHKELIRDPQGAYFQLICLQEGSNEVEESIPAEADQKEASLQEDKIALADKLSWTKSTRRSMNRGSSAASPSVVLPQSEILESMTNARDFDVQQKVSIRRLARLNQPEAAYLLFGTVAAAIFGVIFPIFGLLIGSATKSFYKPPHKLRQDSKLWATVYVGLVVIIFVNYPVQNYFFRTAGGRLIWRISYMTFRKVVHQEISWFDDPTNSSGAIGARLSTDASSLSSLVGDTLSLIVQNIATITAGIVIAFTANLKLSLIVLAVLPFLLLDGYVQGKFLTWFTADAKVKYEEASQVANDAVSSIRTVASFCAEDKVMDLYQKKCKAPKKLGVRLGLVSGTGYGFSFVALCSANAFCFYIGALLVKHAVVISQSSALGPDTNKAKDSAASIFKILDSKPKIDSSKDEGIVLESITGDIELEHVSFKDPTRPDRIYDPDSGQVLLDQVAIQKLKPSWLRRQMGLVNQEPVLFAETIRSNIAYGKQGAQLSGGQKQRIAIARAILKSPRILLLDEATSALDAESELVVQDALEQVMVNRTTVVVAHRLTTIKNADIIAVVKDGVIAEQGSHDTLMKITDGAYASLVALYANSPKVTST